MSDDHTIPDDLEMELDEPQAEYEAPTEEYVRGRFDLGEPILSTRSAEAREGVDREGSSEIYFWVLRYPMAPNSEAEHRFVERLNAMSQLIVRGDLRGKIPNLRDFGVTDSGAAYVAAQYVPGMLPFSLSIAVEERVEIFRSMIEVIAALHYEGIVCGDLCGESFVVNDDDRVTLVGVVGDFEADSKRTAALPPPETLLYVAPEQRLGGLPMKASDVFALGLIGYRFLTGNSAAGEKNPALISTIDELLSTTPPPSSIQHGLPNWIDEILGKCLEEKPHQRYADAGTLLQAFDESETAGFAVDGGGRWAKRTVMIKPRTDAVMLTTIPEEKRKDTHVPQVEQEPLRITKKSNSISIGKLVLGLGMLALGVLTASGYFLFQQGHPDRGETPSFGELIPPELAPAFHDLRAPGVSLEQKSAALKRIAESANPASFALLTQELKGDHPPELKRQGFTFVVDKIRAQGLNFTANIVSKWFETVSATGVDATTIPIYTLLSRACDPTLPLDARRDAIHKGHADDPKLALQLAAALSLDEQQPDRFVPVLRQLLVQAGTGGDMMGRGAGALIFANSKLSVAFQADLLKALPSFSAADLAWAMTRLSEMDSPLLVDLTQEVIRRAIVPPYQGVFLQALAEADQLTLPKVVKIALVKAAQGQITESEVIAIAGWQDVRRETVLLAVGAISPSADIAQSALEALAARAVVTEPAASLIAWVQKFQWESRGILAKPLGILGHLDLAKDSEVTFAFEQLMPFSADGEFLKAIAKTKKSRIIREAVRRVAVITPSEELLMIANPDNNFESEVKISALTALKDRNDVTVLSAIRTMYAAERDEKVLKVYRETFWVIAQQEGKK